MTISLPVIQLALIFLPGIIWAAVDARYVSKRQLSQFALTVNAFLFGISSYAILFTIYSLIGEPFGLIQPIDLESGIAAFSSISDEIVGAIAVALAASVAWVYGSTYKLFNRFLRKIRATKRYGDEDVWDFMFNSPSLATKYVNVRDFDKQIVYSGYVYLWSETDKLRELVIRDAQIHNFDGVKLFDMPYIYIARSPDDIHVEFPYNPRRSDRDEELTHE